MYNPSYSYQVLKMPTAIQEWSLGTTRDTSTKTGTQHQVV